MNALNTTIQQLSNMADACEHISLHMECIVDKLLFSNKPECKKIRLIPDIIPAPHGRCVKVKHKFK